MKITLNWLKEFLTVENSVEEIAAMLTQTGLEVDGIENIDGDTLFDISVTPNLAHCNSVLGIARELAAVTKQKITLPNFQLQEKGKGNIAQEVTVDLKNKEKCPRYSCRLIRDVKLAPSPVWLTKRLEACGVRSINNIVDITNLCMLELGQPLHAFDFDRVAGGNLVIREAKEGEELTTLDDKIRKGTSDDLLIGDKEKPIAFAGVMGGKNTEVYENTCNILLESAYFDPRSIRRTSKRLGLQTDSSRRFERGCDPNMTLFALDRAAALIEELAGGKVVPGLIDKQAAVFPPKVISLSLKKVNALLGTHLNVAEIEDIFSRFTFPCQWQEGDIFQVTVPTYRVDIGSEIDLIEEVARLHGFANIPLKETRYQGTNLPDAPLFILERTLRKQLLGEGLQEFLTCDLIGPSILNIVHDAVVPEAQVVKVLNPTSIEQSIMRTSLLYGLLNVVKYNVDHQCLDIAGFEIGRVHFKEKDRFVEQTVFGILLTGKATPSTWDQKPLMVDFYHLKGIVENILQELGIKDIQFKAQNLPQFHSGRQGAIFAGPLEIGSLGEIHPSILRRIDVEGRIYFAEINLQEILQHLPSTRKMAPLPIYPSSKRDWTLTLKEETPIDEVMGILKSLSIPHLQQIKFSDLFRSEKVGLGKKNATFHFIYRDDSKTIEQQVVDQSHEKLIKEAFQLLKNS